MFSALLLLLFLLLLEYLMHDEVAGVLAALTIFAKKGSSVQVVRVQEEQSSGLCFLIRPKSQSIVGLQQSRT